MTRTVIVGTLCALATLGADAALAAPVTVAPLPGSPYSFGTTADGGAVLVERLNGDNRFDVVVAGGGDPEAVRRLLAPGNPLADPFDVQPVGTGFGDDLLAGDLDNDGDRDFIRVRVDSGAFQSFLNDGNGAFTPGGSYGAGTTTAYTIGQFTADRFPDLIIGRSTKDRGTVGEERQGSLATLHAGTGTGGFGAGTDVSVGDPSLRIARGADTDADGDDDLVVLGNDDQLRVVRNDGNGKFTPLASVTVTGAVTIATGDLDGDKKADAAVLTGAGSIVVLPSSGAAATTSTGLPAETPRGLALADLDGDKVLDYVAAIGTGLRVGIGRGDGTFREARVLTEPGADAVSDVATGDLTGDGLDDVAVSSGPGRRLDLLRNTTPVGLAFPADFNPRLELPYGAVWLSEAPFSARVTGAEGFDVDFDFGEGRAWTEADSANPSAQAFVPDASPRHAYPSIFRPRFAFEPLAAPALEEGESEGVEPGVEGRVPPTAPANQGEVRRVSLVRARITDGTGATRVIGRVVIVRPDTPPKVNAAAVCADCGQDGDEEPLEYVGRSDFYSSSFDPDTQIGTDASGAGRDRIIRERWDFGDGTGLVRDIPACTPQNIAICGAPAQHDYFAARLAGRPPLTAFKTAVGGPPGAAQIKTEAAKLADAAGPAATKDAPLVKLTTVDRSGRSRTKGFTFPIRRRRAPEPVARIGGAKEGDPAAGEILTEPIVAPSENGPGTKVAFDLKGTVADPDGEVAHQILEIGYPIPAPCPALKKCKPGYPSKIGTPQAAAVVGQSGTPGSETLVFPTATQKNKPISVLATAYDETGAVGVTRYDGFVVEASAQDCASFRGRPVGDGLNFSGTCVSTNGDNKLLWTQEPIRLNGLQLRPQPGHWVVVANCAKGKRVLSVGTAPGRGAACETYANAGRPRIRVPGGKKKPPEDPTDLGGDLEVIVDGDAIVRLDTSAQRDLTTRVSKETQYPTAGNRYRGFPLKDHATLRLANDAAEFVFSIALPPQFAPEGMAAPTAKTVVNVSEQRDEVLIKPFNGVSNAPATTQLKPKRGPRARISATPASLIRTPPNLFLGPIPIPSGLPLEYDAATDTFTASFTTPQILPIANGVAAKVKLTLRKGNFVELSSDVDVPAIPIGGVISLTGFGFTVGPLGDGVRLQGRARFADTVSAGLDLAPLTLLTGTGTVTADLNSNFALRVEGTGSLLSFLPVSAGVGYQGSGVTFNAGTGYDFGVASFSETVSGGLSDRGVQVQGRGRACLLGACIGIDGLISERAAAVCGSINLLLVKLSAGLAYVFKGGGINVLKGSCNLGQYASAASGRQALNGDAASYPVEPKPGTDAMSILVPPLTGLAVIPGDLPFGSTPQIELLNPAGTVIAQTSPVLGASSGTGNLAAGGETYGVFVEQDPEAGVARFVVPNPSGSRQNWTGTYTVRRKAGSVPIAPPLVAYTDPPADKGIFTSLAIGDVSDKDESQIRAGKTVVVGNHPTDPTLNRDVKSLKGKRAGIAKLSGSGKLLDAALLEKAPVVNPSTAVYDPSLGIPGSFKVPTAPKTPQAYASSYVAGADLTEYDLQSLIKLRMTGTLPRGQSVDFYEVGPKTTNFIVNSQASETGVIELKDFAFSPSGIHERFGGGEVEVHCIQAWVSDEFGILRGKIDTGKCFKFKPPPFKLPIVKTEVKPGKPGELIIEPHELEAGFQPTFNMTISEGDTTRSFAVSANTVAGFQAKARARRSAGTATTSRVLRARTARIQARITRAPLRKRSFAFRVGGLPKAKGPVRIQVAGISVPGVKGKVARMRTVLKKGQKQARFRSKAYRKLHPNKKATKHGRGKRGKKKHAEKHRRKR